MKKYTAVALGLLIISGCREKEATSPTSPDHPTVNDAQLYQMVLTVPKAAFFKHSPDTIPGNNGGAHAGNILVWYNAKAATQLDAQGKVQSNPSFPDSSLIVKQIFTSANVTTAYAILFKLRAATNAGAGGWVWSELSANGTPLASANSKGSGCSGCHSTVSGLNFDYTRMNDSHP
jgi:hypothetical protein